MPVVVLMSPNKILTAKRENLLHLESDRKIYFGNMNLVKTMIGYNLTV